VTLLSASAKLSTHTQNVNPSVLRIHVELNPFSPTLYLTVAKMNLPRHSVPCWSIHFLNFLTFVHSGAQSWAERQNARMSKN